MEKLKFLDSIAAPLLEDNIDTDVIFPARFLLLLDRQGLGRYAFHERRRQVPSLRDGVRANTTSPNGLPQNASHTSSSNAAGPSSGTLSGTPSGKPEDGRSDFILDQPGYQGAQILVTGSGFGTGSSREQAVWALADLGIRCIIAPSFGEILFANCFKNGVLPVVAGGEDMARCAAAALKGDSLHVDVAAQTVRLCDGPSFTFDLTDHQKQALLLGLDDAGMILAEDLPAIEAYEARRARETPWFFPEKPLDPNQLLNRKKTARNSAAQKEPT